jgi:hypothetical protein
MQLYLDNISHPELGDTFQMLFGHYFAKLPIFRWQQLSRHQIMMACNDT